MLRKILAVPAGVVAAILVVVMIEGIGHVLWPLPPGTDVTDPEVLKGLIATMPFGALASVVVAWILGGFVGGLVSALVGRQSWAPLGVGAIQTAFGIVTMIGIPHPIWMWIVGVVAVIPAAWLGGWMVLRRASGGTA